MQEHRHLIGQLWPLHVTGRGIQGSLQIAEWFDSQNEEGWEGLLQAKQGCDVISLAHFLPHQVTTTAPQHYWTLSLRQWQLNTASTAPVVFYTVYPTVYVTQHIVLLMHLTPRYHHVAVTHMQHMCPLSQSSMHGPR